MTTAAEEPVFPVAANRELAIVHATKTARSDAEQLEQLISTTLLSRAHSTSDSHKVDSPAREFRSEECDRESGDHTPDSDSHVDRLLRQRIGDTNIFQDR